jgi:hypothetical protein
MASRGLPWDDPNSDPLGDIRDALREGKRQATAWYADGIGPSISRPSVSAEPTESLEGFEDDPSDDELADDDRDDNRDDIGWSEADYDNYDGLSYFGDD